MKIKNAFFDAALKQATRIAGKPGRLVNLLIQLGIKLRKTNRSITGKALNDNFWLLGRMLRAYATGKYQVRSFKFLVILIAAVIYFVNPIDIIPDFVLGIGLTDDLAILTWVFQAATHEIEAFAKWEQESNGLTPTFS
ncbi:MAG: DUF1232 domain-containing protein [Cyclobacteriaceae bacterium]|jgi:uncharacterized membrane protein YkvA (DUF1232 family)|nr:DUF1232 domain-containing protein [Cyclobacteriaceae bacterium]